MKTLYTIARIDKEGMYVYLQQDCTYAKTIDKVMLYKYGEMPPLEEGEFSTKVFEE